MAAALLVENRNSQIRRLWEGECSSTHRRDAAGTVRSVNHGSVRAVRPVLPFISQAFESGLAVFGELKIPHPAGAGPGWAVPEPGRAGGGGKYSK